MNLEQVLIKYYEGREWIKSDASISPYERHEYARFFAESDWDDPQAAWRDYRSRLENVNKTETT